MQRDKMREVWREYEVPMASFEAKESCLRELKKEWAHAKKEAVFTVQKQDQTGRQKPRRNLFWVQLGYLRKERIALLFVSFFLLFSGMSLFFPAASGKEAARIPFIINVGSTPFYILPLLFSLYRSKKAKMEELEGACKYNLRDMVLARLVLSATFAICLAAALWAVIGFGFHDFAGNRLWLSLITYNVTLILCLALGRHSMIRGVAGAVVWTILIEGFLQFETTFQVIFAWESSLTFCSLLCTIPILLLELYRYTKSISFEKEEERWNFAWTD